MFKENVNRVGLGTPAQLHEAIRKKAQEIYEKSGRKPGHDLDNWLEAERIVKRERGK